MSWLKNRNDKLHLNRGYQFNLAEETQTIKSLQPSNSDMYFEAKGIPEIDVSFG